MELAFAKCEVGQPDAESRPNFFSRTTLTLLPPPPPDARVARSPARSTLFAVQLVHTKLPGPRGGYPSPYSAPSSRLAFSRDPAPAFLVLARRSPPASHLSRRAPAYFAASPSHSSPFCWKPEEVFFIQRAGEVAGGHLIVGVGPPLGAAARARVEQVLHEVALLRAGGAMRQVARHVVQGLLALAATLAQKRGGASAWGKVLPVFASLEIPRRQAPLEMQVDTRNRLALEAVLVSCPGRAVVVVVNTWDLEGPHGVVPRLVRSPVREVGCVCVSLWGRVGRVGASRWR